MSDDHHYHGILSPQCTAKEMQGYWNKIASRMKPFSKALSTKIYLEQEIKPIQKYLGTNLKGKKILKLDLWNEAFNTEVLVWAAKQRIDVYALDISNKVVEIASKNMDRHGFKKKYKFVVADMRNIPFASNFFDMVYSMGTLEHVDDTTGVINEIYRVLKKQGIVITGIPNKFDIFFRSPILSFANKTGLAPYGEELSFSKKEINKLFTIPNKFKVIDNDGIFLPWFLRYPDMRFYVKFRPACLLFYLPLQLVRQLEGIKWLRTSSGIITCIAKKL